ncbi:hypothetical protein [Sphingomonas kyeonggiensis]|uniref:Uncharacterized protein n=1 Tax=Sphingomonas kyeonggiensis TaxID=1268553 RepID=A0A7W6JWE2_9SPHN|nr:hypothetical protein [Sphingomonas kyeonggiensis]MBB4100785.1 hypothetical protein [Sphingomonas kyeonggiensis]
MLFDRAGAGALQERRGQFRSPFLSLRPRSILSVEARWGSRSGCRNPAVAVHHPASFPASGGKPRIAGFPVLAAGSSYRPVAVFAAMRCRSAAIRWSSCSHDSHLWITLVTISRPSRTEPGSSALPGGLHPMESNERYYRRRAAQELAAARRAMTEAAALRRRQLAETYLKRLAELTGADEMRLLEQEYA